MNAGRIEPKKTMRHQDRIMELFISARKTSSQDAGQLIDQAMEGDTDPLEVAIKEFFETFRVGIYGRNNIRKSISDDTDGEVDIGNPRVFKQLAPLFTNDKNATISDAKLVKQKKVDIASVTWRQVLKGESKEVLKASKERSERSVTNRMNKFRQYCSSKENIVDVELLLEKAVSGVCSPLEKALVDFFSELKVTREGKSQDPNRFTALSIKSAIKQWFLTNSNGKVDIDNPFIFKNLDEYVTERWHRNPASNQRGGKINGGKIEYSPWTEKARNRIMSNFSTYFTSKDNPVDIDSLIMKAKNGNVVPLENSLIEFFKASFAKRKNKWTIGSCRSHIKMSIFEKTNGEVDIGNVFDFKKFNKFYAAFNNSQHLPPRNTMKKLQAKPVPERMQGALHTLLGNLMSVLETRGTDSYDKNLLKLPASCHHNYHLLLRMAAMYIVIMCDVHRGQFSLSATRKNMYRKMHDSATEREWFERTEGGDNVKLEFCGIIPFHSDQYGFNPGRLMDFYQSRLHPDNEYLFQKPAIVGKKFDLHESESDRVPWYTNHNSITLAMPSLCKLAGVPVLDNRSIRASGIQMLKGLGYANLVRSRGHYQGHYQGSSNASEECQEDDSDPGAELDSFEFEEEGLEINPDLGAVTEGIVEQDLLMDQ